MITASIVTYKTSDQHLSTVLTCLLDTPVVTIYIVDNSPTNDLVRYASLSDKIVYLHGQGNVGFGAAHNIAIKRAMLQGATHHLVLNSDIVFGREVVSRIVEYMTAHPDVAQVMPKIILPSGETQRASNLIPTPFDLIFKRFLPKALTRSRMEQFQLLFTGYTQTMNVPYLTGCFLCFKVEALERVGLFDERFFMYPEDIDITRRMHREYRTMFYPEVQIVHEHAAESRKNWRMLWIHITNMVKYFNKWGWIFDRERREMNRAVLNELRSKK